MLIACDFDGTIVSEAHDYDDVTTPLVFEPGAKEALAALKKAGHVLILSSARTNLALWVDPKLDPLVRVGKRQIDDKLWGRMRPVHLARIEQMTKFVDAELPGIFDAVDFGDCGKIVADIYVDNRAIRFGAGQLALTWDRIATMYGERT